MTLVIALLLAVGLTVAQDDAKPSRATLVELYTSQG